jgi:hypothetical protein
MRWKVSAGFIQGLYVSTMEWAYTSAPKTKRRELGDQSDYAPPSLLSELRQSSEYTK